MRTALRLKRLGQYDTTDWNIKGFFAVSTLRDFRSRHLFMIILCIYKRKITNDLNYTLMVIRIL